MLTVLAAACQSEVAALADHFDQDHDGKVSLAEFEQFCLSIPHVSWRAEKMRADRSVRAAPCIVMLQAAIGASGRSFMMW